MSNSEIQYRIYQRDHEQRLKRSDLHRMMEQPTNKQAQHTFIQRITRMVTLLFL